MVQAITIRPGPIAPIAQPQHAGKAEKLPQIAQIVPRSADYFANRYGDKSVTRKTAGLQTRLAQAQAENAPHGGQAQASGPDFFDFLDVINPLQHIPGVAQLYREITGDTIRPETKLAGGALFGGPIGFALSAVDAAVQAETGRDIGQTLLAAFEGEGATPLQAAPVQVAKVPTETKNLTEPSVASSSHEVVVDPAKRAHAVTQAQAALLQQANPVSAGPEAEIALQSLQQQKALQHHFLAAQSVKQPGYDSVAGVQVPAVAGRVLPPKLPDVFLQGKARKETTSGLSDGELLSLVGTTPEAARRAYDRAARLRQGS